VIVSVVAATKRQHFVYVRVADKATGRLQARPVKQKERQWGT
jgi:hypothetical protein